MTATHAHAARLSSTVGTVLHNPVTGEYARTVEATAAYAVGELLARPGGAVARRRGRTVTTDDVLRAAVVAPEAWPG